MTDNTSEFLLSLVGTLDEATTKKNVQNALDKISTSVSLKSNKAKNKITVFDKEQLEKDGIAYLKDVKNIESQLSELFKNIGTSFSVKKTFADDGSVSKFVATIYEGTKAIQTLNFEAAKFTDKSSGFRQVGGTSTSEKFFTQETELIKAENEQINVQEVLLGRLSQAKKQLNDGSISSDSLKLGKLNEDIRLLENQIKGIDFSKIGNEGKAHLNSVTNAILEAVDAEHKLHNVMMDQETGVFNIPVIEKEGISFYENTVGVVERVKQELIDKGYTPKIDILGRDAEGNVTSFAAKIKNTSGVVDTLNYSLVQLNDGYKTFEGFMSSYGKQIDNTSEQNYKSFQKQSKQLATLNEEIKKIESTALNKKSGSALFDESNINKVRSDLDEIKGIYDVIYKGHNNKEIIQTEAFDLLNIKLKEINNNISNMSDEERLSRSLSKGMDSQLDALNRYDQKVKDIFSKYAKNGKNELFNTDNVNNFNKLIGNTITEISRLQQKAGSVTSEEARNLSNMVNGLQRTLSSYYQREEEERKLAEEANKTAQAYEQQKYKLEAISLEARKLYDSTFNNSNQLVNEKNITEAQKKIRNLSLFIDGLYTKHNKGDIIPADAFTRFDLKLKETTQDVKEMRNEEVLLKNSTKDMESQLNTLNGFEEKLKNIRSNFLSDDGKKRLDNLVNVQDLQTSLSNIDGIIDRMKLLTQIDPSKNTQKEYRELLNAYNAAERLANKYYDIETAQNKNNESLRKQTNELNSYFNELTKINRTTLSSNNGKGLVDTQHISDIRKQYFDLLFSVQEMKTKVNAGELIPVEQLDKLSSRFEKIRQDISVFKVLDGTIESQKNSLASVEQRVLSLQSKLLDGSKIQTPAYFNDINNKVANISTAIEILMSKAGSITDEEARKLSSMVSELQRVGDEYARIDANQIKYNNNLNTQATNIKNIYTQLEQINRTTLNPKASSNLKDSEHLVTVRNQYAELIKMMYLLDKQVKSGQMVNANDLQKANDLLTKMQTNIRVFKDEETLIKNATSSMESQLNTLNGFEEKIKNLQAKYFGENSGVKLLNIDHANQVTNKLNDVTNMINKMRDSTSTNTQESYRMLTNEYNAVIRLADGFVEAEKAQAKQEETLRRQTNDLQKASASLNAFIDGLQRDKLLEGEVRQQTENLIKEFNNIKTPADLSTFNSHLETMKINVDNLRKSIKATADQNDLQQKLQILSSQVNGYMQQNTRAATLFKESFKELQAGIGSAKTNEDLLRLQNNFKLLQQNVQNAGKAGMTFGERMSAAVKKFMMWTGMTNVVMYLVRSIKQMVTNVKELDSAMISLKKVTDETDYTYSKIFDDASKKAQELNTSIKDIINSTAEFAKLGFTTEQAQELANVASVYSNVGGNSPICYSNVA